MSSCFYKYCPSRKKSFRNEWKLTHKQELFPYWRLPRSVHRDNWIHNLPPDHRDFDFDNPEHSFCVLHFEDHCIAKTRSYAVNNTAFTFPLFQWRLKRNGIPTIFEPASEAINSPKVNQDEPEYEELEAKEDLETGMDTEDNSSGTSPNLLTSSAEVEVGISKEISPEIPNGIGAAYLMGELGLGSLVGPTITVITENGTGGAEQPGSEQEDSVSLFSVDEVELAILSTCGGNSNELKLQDLSVGVEEPHHHVGREETVGNVDSRLAAPAGKGVFKQSTKPLNTEGAETARKRKQTFIKAELSPERDIEIVELTDEEDPTVDEVDLTIESGSGATSIASDNLDQSKNEEALELTLVNPKETALSTPTDKTQQIVSITISNTGKANISVVPSISKPGSDDARLAILSDPEKNTPTANGVKSHEVQVEKIGTLKRPRESTPQDKQHFTKSSSGLGTTTSSQVCERIVGSLSIGRKPGPKSSTSSGLKKSQEFQEPTDKTPVGLNIKVTTAAHLNSPAQFPTGAFPVSCNGNSASLKRQQQISEVPMLLGRKSTPTEFQNSGGKNNSSQSHSKSSKTSSNLLALTESSAKGSNGTPVVSNQNGSSNPHAKPTHKDRKRSSPTPIVLLVGSIKNKIKRLKSEVHAAVNAEMMSSLVMPSQDWCVNTYPHPKTRESLFTISETILNVKHVEIIRKSITIQSNWEMHFSILSLEIEKFHIGLCARSGGEIQQVLDKFAALEICDGVLHDAKGEGITRHTDTILRATECPLLIIKAKILPDNTSNKKPPGRVSCDKCNEYLHNGV